MNSKKWLLFTISLFVLSGCSQPLENDTSSTPIGIQYTAENLFETADDRGTVVLPVKDSENQEATELPEITEVPEYLKPQENLEYVKYDGANRCLFPDDDKNLRSLFCLDPDTGIAYFVNQNKDWYIYRLINGEAELVVELPARELYVLNGIVYFILENYDKYELGELTEGDVYAYSIADGSIRNVFSANMLETKIYRMRPYEDGIAFYCKMVTEVDARVVIINGKSFETNIQTDYSYYYYTFANATLETDLYKRAIPGWEEYYLVLNYAEWEAVLWSRISHEQGKLDVSVSPRVVIVENIMYSFGAGKCQVTNLLTKEYVCYDILAMLGELAPAYVAACERSGLNFGASIDGFTVTKDYVWITLNNYFLMRLDPVSGEAKCYSLAGLNSKLCELYTDGINLYATYAQTGEWKNKGTLVRICTEEIVGQDSLFDVPLLAVEHLTD